MKALLASTAVVLAFAGPVLADSHANMEDVFSATPDDGVYRGTNLIGATLWQTENDVDVDAETVDPDSLEWNMVGEINDLIISRDGEVDHVIAAVGGVLGLGQKTISVKMDALKFIRDGQEADDWFVVLTTTPAALEEAPEYDTSEQADASQTMTTEDGATEQANTAVPMKDGEDGDDTEMANAETDAKATEETPLTAEALTGVAVTAAGDESVGEVSQLILSDDGATIEQAVIDVGGFLGIGEKPVALPIDRMRFERDSSGEIVRVMIDMPREELEAMDAWEKG